MVTLTDRKLAKQLERDWATPMDSERDDEENVANGSLMSGETLHQAKAIDIELGADEMSSAPNDADNNPEPKCQDEV